MFLQAEQNKTTIEGLLRERDFYFNKLRSIEIICQENRKVDLTKSIFEILYATEVSRFSSHLILNKYFHLINYNVGDHFFSSFTSLKLALVTTRNIINPTLFSDIFLLRYSRELKKFDIIVIYWFLAQVTSKIIYLFHLIIFIWILYTIHPDMDCFTNYRLMYCMLFV